MPKENPLLYVDSNYASPYAMSSFVALREKGVAFELETVDLGAKMNQQPAYAAKSLTRRVPTLVHEGFSLSESSAIDEYVDEVFAGPKLYPADAKQRARARQLQAWLRSDLMPIREERPTTVIFREPSKAALSNEAQAAAQTLFYAAESLLAAGSDNLFGAWSIADADLALMLNRLVMNGDTVPERLAAYAKKQWQRPSVRAWTSLKRP
jgi:glutathione S-transferase